MKKKQPDVRKRLFIERVPPQLSSAATIDISSLPHVPRRDIIRVHRLELIGKVPKQVADIRTFSPRKSRIQADVPGVHRWLVKTGERHYPIESITEHLLTRLGNVVGVNMAFTKLMVIEGQVRLCSRIFVSGSRALVHGAEILSKFLDDPTFVQDLTGKNKNIAKQHVTLSDIDEALGFVYPSSAEELGQSLRRMLLFDAYVGCTDRHLYNWGVIVNALRPEQRPRFSPLFDSARGLYWRHLDGQIDREVLASTWPTNFINNAKCEIGLTPGHESTLLDVAGHIAEHADNNLRHWMLEKFTGDTLNRIFAVIDVEFAPLLGVRRCGHLKALLQARHTLFCQRTSLQP